jgi:hypothetical protein
MTVSGIIKAVRLCIDEEAANAASLAAASVLDGSAVEDSSLMDNIIRAKIPDALRWVCLYAPTEMLAAADTTSSIDIITEEQHTVTSGNTITPQKTLLRLIRVKGNNWHRAVYGDSLISEDSDMYLQLRDTNGAQATVERPQAALLNTKKRQVEVWPADDTFTLTYLRTLSDAELQLLSTDATTVTVPPLTASAFIYYLVFLLLSAYDDTRAERMLTIAQMNLGQSK